MKILILGAGKMGTFFSDLLSRRHRVAVFDIDPDRLRFTYNVERFSSYEEVRDFAPELVINAVTLKYTIPAFESVLPHISHNCILSDIASVKTDLPEFYKECGHPFVSSHPMFGPTFASLSNLSNENAVVITEGDSLGQAFFKDLYRQLNLNVAEYTFEEHDRTVAYSLSIPFAATLAFAGVMKPQKAPGTTFKRHLQIARGLMSEDEYLVSEILFNPNTPRKLAGIIEKLSELKDIVECHDSKRMGVFLAQARENISRQDDTVI